MSLPTAEQITNFYLYGQEAIPANMADPSVVNEAGRAPLSVNVQEYMTSGAGRFVSAADFDFVKIFFDFPDLAPLSPGSYSKNDLFNVFGLSDKDNSVTFNNINYGLNDADYAERTYIWGTVGFAVSNDAVFIVNEDGSRNIENFSIVPLQVIQPDRREDFDFNGGRLSNIGNNWLGLYDTIDPARIGKIVTLQFTGDVTKTSLTLEQFSQLSDDVAWPSVPSVSDINKIWELTDKLFAAGSTRFLHDGKPIIYGNSGDNVMEGDIANDDAIDFHMASHRQLGQYVKNGIVYVAGDGNDTVNATQNNDILLGGNGDDILNPGTGFDRINGGAGNDRYQIEADFGNVIIAGDTDGGTISLLSSVQFRRVSGQKNQDGLFAALDDKGEWLAGLEGWSVSVSGSTASVSIVDAGKQSHTIAIENFNISANNFGLQLLEKIDAVIPAQSNAYTVGNGHLGFYTPTGGTEPVEVFMPENRAVENNAESGIDVEQYSDKSLTYNAGEFWQTWNADELRWVDEKNLGDEKYAYGKEYANDQWLLFDSRSAWQGANDMRFEGSSQNDYLYGNDWTSRMQAIKAWDTANGENVFGLDGMANFDPAANGNNDVLFGLEGDDLIIGDGNQDSLQQPVTTAPQAGNRDILVGGRGSDVIYGQGGHDALFAMEEYRYRSRASVGLLFDKEKYGSLSEALFKNAYMYDAKTGKDTTTAIALENNGERNYLNGGDGSDVIEGASYADMIDGGKDADWIYAGAGKDIIAGGEGNDEISGDSYAYFIDGLAHSDFIAPDELPGENDYRRAYFYKDNGGETILRHNLNKDTDYNDIIDGGAGDDFIMGEIGSDQISGGSGKDTIFGDRYYGAGNYAATPPANFQSLSKAFHGNDVIDGGDGEDTLIGGGGNDQLSGGMAADVIYGDVGLDVYDMGKNTGDTPDAAIKASDDGWWGKDFILGAQGGDTLVGEGDDDVLDGGDGADFLYGDWGTWQTAAFNAKDSKTGNDKLYGGDGNDQLMGNGGDDALEGGGGDDKLIGDSLRGSEFSGTGNDVLAGGAGNDSLYGGSGNDVLNGGTGADYLNGGDGDDTYIYEAGGGADVIVDTRGNSTLFLSNKVFRTILEKDNAIIYLSDDGRNNIQISLDSLYNVEKIYANGEVVSLTIIAPDENETYMLDGREQAYSSISGTQGSDVFVFSDAYEGQFTLRGFQGNDSVVVANSWSSEGYLDASIVSDRWYKTEGSWSGNHFENVTYYQTDYLLTNHAHSSGTIRINSDSWDPAEEMYLDSGELANLRIMGNAEHNVIYGKSGNDLLAGGGGHDIIHGGAGDDTLEGGAGKDTLYGGAGDDTLYVDESDVAFGGDGNDTFFAVANTSSGKAMGGAGADIFNVKTVGDWSNLVITDEFFDVGDVIQLDVNADAILLRANSIELLTSDRSAVEHSLAFYLEGCPKEELWDRMQNLAIRFADGEVWDAGEIRLRASAGTAFSDLIVGDAEGNILHGKENSDTLFGLAGSDSLFGDAGDDILVGGAGDDVFHFGAGSGNDIIDERMDRGWHRDADIIEFDSSVSGSGITLTHAGQDLVIGVEDTGETLTLAGFLADDESNNRNIKLSFANGSTNNMAYIERELFRRDSGLALYGDGTEANNTIKGNAASNYIYGNAGDDIIDGKAGNDWIDGGAGNDSLTGGYGADTFRLGIGSGQDVIADNAEAVAFDQLRLDFTTGVNDLTIEVLANAGELKIGRHDSAGDVTDSVRVNNALGHLVDIDGNDITVDAIPLLQLVNEKLASRTITLARNQSEDRYVALSANDLLGDGFGNAEKSRWQITAAQALSGTFGLDKADIDMDEDTAEQTFFYVENLFGSGVNYIGFLPPENIGNASFQFTLQRDDGLTFISTMNVSVQDNSLIGTSGNDIIDGGQSNAGITIAALAGDDLVRDGYGDDELHGGDGNDTLTHNWQGNGNDAYYGDAGNDTLDAGWGSDTMVGGSGNDTYIEGNLWSGDHTLIDNSTAATGDNDTLQIGREGYGMWDYRSLWFTADGNDLLVSQLDGLEPGEIRIKDWFDAANPDARLDAIRVQQDDGNVYETYLGANFDALVQAMAGFAPPAGVGAIDSSLADEYHAAWMLASPIAA